MKKLLTLLLTLLMVFMLVGCNSEENTPVVEEPIKQEEVVEEVKQKEPEIVGGYIDIEDGTLTDEIKDIFNSALEGLMGASYEPVELVATQVVAGTNYKFKANGTKTTNPITKGTYFIYVNKDLQGNVSLLDIETIQEEAAKQDVTQMSFWVVFYDQYGNELQREALKYGTVPEYKSWLPEGFDKWVYKKSQKDVGTLKAITGNTYYQAVCHEVYHSSSDPTPEPTPTVTNYIVSFNLNGSTGTTPDSQTIANGNLVTKPDDPTYAYHTFAGWYKTKNQTTGVLSDPWDFETDAVSADMTLYAKWTRRIVDIIETVNFPMSTNDIPTNAWMDSSKPNNRIYGCYNLLFNILYVKVNSQSDPLLYQSYGGSTPDGAEKVDNSYIYSNDDMKYTLTFNVTNEGKLESIEIKAHDDAGQSIKDACGTYKAPSSSPVLCSNTDDLYYIYGEPFGPVLGGDMADSYIFKYDGQLFEYNSHNMQATFNRLSSSEMVKKDHWYHIVDGIPVECTDPNHHEVEIPV